MPFMDGEETFVRLRQIFPEVVVLLSTGFMAQDRVDRMLAAGLAGFLRKPHKPDELLAHVQATLEKVKITRAGCATTDARNSF
ncbi:MAG: two-component system, cell cycle sensor histidine kinase and response regulator CckA [Verrucomicrobiota bacterium]